MIRPIVPRSNRKASAGLVKNGVSERDTDMQSGWGFWARRSVAALLVAGLAALAGAANAEFIVRGDAVFDTETALSWERVANKSGNDVSSWG